MMPSGIEPQHGRRFQALSAEELTGRVRRSVYTLGHHEARLDPGSGLKLTLMTPALRLNDTVALDRLPNGVHKG